jgi:fucose 4-O-acetylase-like acetyltransferase
VSTTLDRHAPAATDSARAPLDRAGTSTAPTSTAIRTAEPAAPPAPAGRVALWDNARLIVMVLVVFGHLIESIRGTGAVDDLYAVVYAFHMPAFLLMSGVFASSDRLSPKRLAGTAQLLATWLVVEFAWVLLRIVNGDHPFPATFLVMPKWGAWFLVSLFTMRVLLPYIALLPHPIVLSSLVALGVGLIPSIGQQFSVSRTLTLLPFFLLGWAIKQRELDRRAWFRAPSVPLRLAALVTFAVGAAAVLLLMAMPHFSWELLTWRRGYAAMHYGPLHGVALRAATLALAAVMTFALLLLVPRRTRWFTRLGENTLYVYVLHIPIIQAFQTWHLDTRIAQVPLSAVVAFAVAIVITFVLSQPVVKRLTQWILEPRWLFRRALERRPA